MMTQLLYALFFAMLPMVVDGADPMTISGRVTDAQHGEPLAFVNIVSQGSRIGTMTDIDGFFELTLSDDTGFLLLSYVGYEPKTFELSGHHGPVLIQLTRKPIELAEVLVLPGENPAHRIIDLVIANRDRHHPERMGSFSYESYNKFTFTGDFEQGKVGHERTDTAGGRLQRYLEERHFFMMETVAERKFRYPDRSNETILASRISGLQNPLFAMLMAQMQSFSFYDDYIRIFDRQFLSPLTPGSTNRYFFLLEDTTYVGRDTVYVVSYRPGRDRNFEGLRGVMYINSQGWALQSVIAEPADEGGNTRIKIQQNYALIQGRQWFPVQLNTDFELINLNDISGFRVLGLGRTYLQDIRLDPPLTRKDFSPFYVEFSPESIIMDDDFWHKYRTDTLSVRELNTYHYLDSIGRDRDLDGQVERMESLLSGYWRRGALDVKLSSLLRYNSFEGFRPGLALKTNDRFSQWFNIHGMIAYGFGDQTLKYGAGSSLLLDRLSDLRLGYHYSYDVAERGGSDLADGDGILSTQYLRFFVLRHFDMMESHQAWLNMRTFRNQLTIRPYAALEKVQFPDNYQYVPSHLDLLPGSSSLIDARFFELGVQLRLALGERFIKTPDRVISLGNNVPEVHLHIARGLEGAMDGQYGYWRVESMLQRQFNIPMLGRQSWMIRAGLFSGEAPLFKRFHPPAAFSRFAIAIPGTFATMRSGEFFSDRYIALFWYHHFENLLFRGERFNPQIVLLTNAMAGSLGDVQNHDQTGFRTLEKGYIESGIAILDLVGSGVSSLGVACMFRYGPYALPEVKQNLSVRLAYRFLF